MGFFGLLRSIEELLYEVMTWLVFYPRTLWRVAIHPMRMIDYSEKEQGDTAAEQYSDTLSPPLFLMLTILIAHGVELSMGQKTPALEGPLAKLLANSEEMLLLYRSIIFSIYPLMFAVASVKRGNLELDRNTLRAPFFSQCYLGALFALLVSLSATAITYGDASVRTGALIVIGLVVFAYIAMQAAWLRMHLAMDHVRSALVSLGTFLKATLIVMLISSVLAV